MNGAFNVSWSIKATSRIPMLIPLERTCKSEYTQDGCFRRPAQGRAGSPQPDSGQEID